MSPPVRPSKSAINRTTKSALTSISATQLKRLHKHQPEHKHSTTALEPVPKIAVRPKPWLGPALAISGSLLFGCTSVLVKLCYPHGVSPLTVLCLRLVVALPLFLAIGVFERVRAGTPLTWTERLVCAAIGLAGYHLASWLDFEALALIPVGLERMVLFAFPTFVVLFSMALYRKKPHPAVLGCLAITYVGIVMTFLGEMQLATHWQTTALGVGLVFLAALVFAASYLGAGTYSKRLGSRRFTATAMTAACIGTLSHGLVTGVNFDQVPAPVWGYAVMLGVGATVVATLCMNEGMRRVGPQRSAIMSCVSPVMAVALAWFVLDEHIGAFQALGMVITVSGATAMGFFKAEQAGAPARATASSSIGSTIDSTVSTNTS
jgi:drug/metabolite transporter (DMT)-like permease